MGPLAPPKPARMRYTLAHAPPSGLHGWTVALRSSPPPSSSRWCSASAANNWALGKRGLNCQQFSSPPTYPCLASLSSSISLSSTRHLHPSLPQSSSLPLSALFAMFCCSLCFAFLGSLSLLFCLGLVRVFGFSGFWVFLLGAVALSAPFCSLSDALLGAP